MKPLVMMRSISMDEPHGRSKRGWREGWPRGQFLKNIELAVFFLMLAFVKMPLFLAWNNWPENDNIGDIIRCFKMPKLCYKIGNASVEIENASSWQENTGV